MAICNNCDKFYEEDESNAMNNLDYCDMWCEMHGEDLEEDD